MKEDISAYTKRFKIGLFDLDASGTSSILTIANFLQEGGMSHGKKVIERGRLKEHPRLAFTSTPGSRLFQITISFAILSSLMKMKSS